jgi:hypothetical protein
MWRRNTNERSILHECPRCRTLTSIVVGHTGSCSKCTLNLTVDKDIAKAREKAAVVRRACREPLMQKGMHHGRGN